MESNEEKTKAYKSWEKLDKKLTVLEHSSTNPYGQGRVRWVRQKWEQHLVRKLELAGKSQYCLKCDRPMPCGEEADYELRSGDRLEHNKKCMFVGSKNSMIVNYNLRPVSDVDSITNHCRLCESENQSKCIKIISEYGGNRKKG